MVCAATHESIFVQVVFALLRLVRGMTVVVFEDLLTFLVRLFPTLWVCVPVFLSCALLTGRCPRIASMVPRCWQSVWAVDV